MNRHVFPELLHAAGAPIVVDGKPRNALRWILNTSVGMPRALFNVWRFGGKLPTKDVVITRKALDDGSFLLSWAEGPGAAIQLTVTVPSGTGIVLRAFSGAAGAAHAVDEETVIGPVTDLPVVLFGSLVASVILMGTGTVTAGLLVPLYDLVNDPGWVLVETVGLPADKDFDSSGYPLDKQGPPGQELPPVDAAIRRVKEGTPDAGWPTTTDRGMTVPAFVPPDPTLLVTKELQPLLSSVGKMLKDVLEPAEHAAATSPIKVQAPRSIHGVDAPAHWQDQSGDSDLHPLGGLLVTAGTDPFAALALGFGTTLTPGSSQKVLGATAAASATTPPPVDFYMVTVQHKVTQKITIPGPLSLSIEVTVDGELAALCLELQRSKLQEAGSLSAQQGTLDPPPHLDPPGAVDGRWLEVARVSWAFPVITADSISRPTGYAVARSFDASGASPMEIRTEPRISGGFMPFVAARDPKREPAAVIRFTDSGVEERFPGDAATVVYSVASTDWFGRWSSWLSADHTRISVATQIPAVRRVTIDVADGATPVRSAAAQVEFTWDWSHRRPKSIVLRTLVHAEGTPAPGVSGSVLAVGGPTVADTVIDFSSASIDAPPPGVAAVPDEATGNLRTYRVTVPGLSFAFDSHPRVRVTVRAHATERVGSGLPSQWSSDSTAQAASPVPPPPPFVPTAMQWASVPDPRGISRVTLTWSPSAPRYAVYLADETAICRELGLPSPDLESSSAERLVGLRPRPFNEARRAFRRVADNLTETRLAVELPRGSRMIHFYAVVPISATGKEGALPAAGNDYIAVAAPVVRVPEIPKLTARDQGGIVKLFVEVPETRVPVSRVELFRAPSLHRAVSVEHAGPPFAILEASLGVRSGGVIRFQLDDMKAGRPWQSAFYRALAWGATDLALGVHGGRSEPTQAVEVVVTATTPPVLDDLRVEDVSSFPEHRLVSFLSDVTLALTKRGAHVFSVQSVLPDMSTATYRTRADVLPLLTGTLPGPTQQPETVFQFDPAEPRSGRIYAWVPRTARAVIVEIADPSGRTTRETWSAT